MRGKEIMSLALAMNDLIGFDRNSLEILRNTYLEVALFQRGSA